MNIRWTRSENPALRKLWARVRLEGVVSLAQRLTPGEVWAAINAFTDLFPGTDNGPAHIVLSDGNVEVEHIAGCIRGSIESLGQQQDTVEVIHFLACLLELSDAERVRRDDPQTVWAKEPGTEAEKPDDNSRDLFGIFDREYRPRLKVKCPDCGEWTLSTEWQTMEVYCEDCSDFHDGYECPNCKRVFGPQHHVRVAVQPAD